MPFPTAPVFVKPRRRRPFLELLADLFGLACLIAFLTGLLLTLAFLAAHARWPEPKPESVTQVTKTGHSHDPCRKRWTPDARFVVPDTPECRPTQTEKEHEPR